MQMKIEKNTEVQMEHARSGISLKDQTSKL
jgi:hypothetical protein